jgi:hypothetical protein
MKEKIHKWKPGTGRGGVAVSPECGRGVGQVTRRNASVTCGRCKLLAKFAAKRAAKKGK